MFVKKIASGQVAIGAPAKINLFLEVLDRRDDGYHNINSLFQAVSLFDRLQFRRTRDHMGAAITLTRPSELPTDENNLIVKAFDLLRDRFDITGGLDVELEKNIPIAAGLAGGSADGAATILAGAILFDLPLDFAEMAGLGLELGSDLPFFFTHGQALVSGRGEVVQETSYPADYWLVLVTPDLAVSTAEAYAQLSLRLTKSRIPFTLERCDTPHELVKSLGLTGNDFEEVHLKSYPDLRRIRSELLDRGALLARISGSGPSVFGFYCDAPDIDGGNLAGRADWRTTTVRPVTLPARLP
ncbi:MAG: 4-(cytidine 5'-diphospho)-2-C-methyl-D-erythritol kinase [bacterium]|nr:4-(cytidine 5'-diphospho)-2-C-methyl-D-erythritol kinase [bacterium]